MAMKNSNKRQLITSVMSLGLTVAMLTGTTLAWFTDSASTGVNKIKAGNLDVELNYYADGEWKDATDVKLFDYDKWEPGYMVVQGIQVKNAGDLALEWQASIQSTHPISKLGDAIDVYVKEFNNNYQKPTRDEVTSADGGWSNVGKLSDFIKSISSTTTGIITEKGGSEELGIALVMNEESGNEYQGLDLGGDITLVIDAKQETSETDSFGSDYDENATMNLRASTQEQFVDAAQEINAKGSGKIVLDRDIEITLNDNSMRSSNGSVITIEKGKELTVDLNGKNIKADLDTKTASNIATSLFNVKKGGKLTIIGNGSINTIANKSNEVDNKVSAMINNEAGTVVIEDGTYTMEAGSYADGYFIPTLIDNNSTNGESNVIINGGRFEYHRNMFRNFANHIDKCANIVINKGTFVGTDEDGASIWNQKPNSNKGDRGTVTVNGGTFEKVNINNGYSEDAIKINNGVKVDVLYK